MQSYSNKLPAGAHTDGFITGTPSPNTSLTSTHFVWMCILEKTAGRRNITFNLYLEHEINSSYMSMCVFAYTHKGYIKSCMLQNLGQQTAKHITFLDIFFQRDR